MMAIIIIMMPEVEAYSVMLEPQKCTRAEAEQTWAASVELSEKSSAYLPVCRHFRGGQFGSAGNWCAESGNHKCGP